MRFSKTISTLTLALLISGCSYLGIGAKQFPYQDNAVFQKHVSGALPLICPSGYGVKLFLDVNDATGDARYVFYATEDGKWMAAEFEAGKVVYLYSGTVKPGSSNLVQRESHKFNRAKEGQSGPCQALGLGRIAPSKTAYIT